MAHQTYVVYRGPSALNGEPVLCTLGCVVTPSANKKTGPMLMVSVFHADLPPHEAWKTGADAAVCGQCPLRPWLSSPGELRCFMTQTAALFLGSAWHAAHELPVDLEGAARAISRSRRKLRLGHYGNMSAVPPEVVRRLVASVRTRGGYGTCYEHEWRDPAHAWLRELAMASVESESDAVLAQALGWRTYRIREEGAPLLDSELACPHYTHGVAGRPAVQCADCGLCNGLAGRDPAQVRSITAPPKRPHTTAHLPPAEVEDLRAQRAAGATIRELAGQRGLGEWRVRRLLGASSYRGVGR